MDEKFLQDARRKAERAVADMADGALKAKAFEVILTRLLAGDGGAAGAAPAKPAKGRPEVDSGGSPRIATTLPDRILALRDEKFFAEQRSIGELREELRRHGWHYPVTRLSGPLQSLVQQRKLRREKTRSGDNKRGWQYSNY